MGRRRYSNRRAKRTNLPGVDRTGLRYEEVFTFSVQAGQSTTVTKATMGSLPANTNFRPGRWTIEAMQAYVPGSATLPGYYCPGSLQIEILEGTPGAGSTTSGLRLLASGVTRINVTPRASYDWLDHGLVASTPLLRIDGVCIGQPAGTDVNAYIRGVVRCLVDLQPELSATSCPAYVGPDRDAPSTALTSEWVNVTSN